MTDLASTDTAVIDTPPADAALTQAEPTTTQPDAATGAEKEPQGEPRTFTQAELEAATAKAAAKAERRAYREALALRQDAPQQQQPAQQPVDQRPAPREGESNADYIDRLTDWKLAQRDARAQQESAQKEQQAAAARAKDLFAKASEVPGFDLDEFAQQAWSPAACDAILDSDVGPNLMAFLTSNPEEAKRILALSPARQAAEIGKLEARVVPAPKVSKAPPPVRSIGSQGAGLQKSIEQMTPREVEESMRARGSKWVR